jgi:thiamine biosynthesis protein ThiS
VRVRVNGEEREVEAGTTIVDLLTALGLASDRVAVERNRELVVRARHAETLLEPDDELEIVTLVGGG